MTAVDRGPARRGEQLTLSDVWDLRAYERIRDSYRTQVMARKTRRRVALGPLMTVVFECFDTVRFQVHEMARVEKILSDEAIQVELDVYNRLLPAADELSATLLIELTSESELREWLPKLVGIESHLAVAMGPELVRSVPETQHAAALTREAVTSAVHYLRFPFSQAQTEAFQAAPEVSLMAVHPAYEAETLLAPPVREELLGDLLGTTKPLTPG